MENKTNTGLKYDVVMIMPSPYIYILLQKHVLYMYILYITHTMIHHIVLFTLKLTVVINTKGIVII